MRPRYALALLLLLTPGVARAAEEAPEQLLPAGTQVYLRWDGVDAHRAAYAKTALGKMMQGDTGAFVAGAFDQIQEGIGALLTVEQLLNGVEPDKLVELRADATKAARLVPLVGKSGFLLAAEVRGLEPPQAQLTLILPGAGPNAEPLFAALRLSAGLLRAEVKKRKIDGRDVSYVSAPPVNLTWWVEGKHALVRLGTAKPDDLVKAVTAKGGARLPSNPLFQRVAGFKAFPTSARAFVDVAAFVKLADKRGPEVTRLLADLGVDGLKSLVFYSGFQGEAERGLVEVDVAGPRRGALALFKGKPFRLSDVPPLPPDVVSWSMTNLDLGALYDVSLKTAENVAKLIDPDAAQEVQAFAKKANDVLGVDLRKDLLGSLGDRFANYNTPSEGPLTLGQTFLFKVKDEARLAGALDKAIRGLAKAGDADVRIRKRTYRGVVLREVIVRERGFPFRPTYAIHDGWLVVSFFPQPVQGYVARAKGDMARWKPSPRVQATLKELPKEFISVSYSDPRPGLKQLLSIAPLIGGLIDSLNPDINFDVGSLPNAQEVTRHLFANVSVVTDDGKTIRLESRASLALPFDISGIDAYGLLFLSFARLL
jgi:hypothetical protein